MFFPTWLEMVLFLVSFVWSTIQQRYVQSASSSIVRLLLMASYVLIMLGVVLYNDVNAWLSTGFFVVSVASLGITVQLYRRMPARLPDEPRF